jgi:hypothetical protein
MKTLRKALIPAGGFVDEAASGDKGCAKRAVFCTACEHYTVFRAEGSKK